jgi:hypothetical protein
MIAKCELHGAVTTDAFLERPLALRLHQQKKTKKRGQKVVRPFSVTIPESGNGSDIFVIDGSKL